MVMKGDELVQYITEQVITYVETPRKERKRIHQEKQAKELGVNLWFGMIPVAISLWMNEKRGKSKTPPVALTDKEGGDHFAE